jgi:hypothetical protein
MDNQFFLGSCFPILGLVKLKTSQRWGWDLRFQLVLVLRARFQIGDERFEVGCADPAQLGP